ncbi:bifunctional DNA primase/polymerase [Enterococcus faecalis]|uniref:bifunctional DNA primase/polymerase n=1 Tax=Enterococcus faecalis TaxID=1351 RepID=UPI0015718C58|nr:bifunctional DNA primase/polymerase [Enterococcus faecalis]
MSKKYIDVAISYAKNNCKVFPLTPFTKIPLKGTRGSKEATTDIEQIKKWWNQTPNANIGLVTDRFLVLDIDVHDKENNGYESLETLKNTFGELPDTSIVQTANNGLHIYLLKPQGVQLPQKIAFMKGIDVKAHPNNYVVAPPSEVKRLDGTLGKYEMKEKFPIAESPKWLIDFILRHEPKQSKATKIDSHLSNRYRTKTTDLLERLVLGATTGARNDTIARTTGQLLAYGVKIPLAWELIQFMNGNFDEPLAQRELESTFLSICKRELKIS